MQIHQKKKFVEGDYFCEWMDELVSSHCLVAMLNDFTIFVKPDVIAYAAMPFANFYLHLRCFHPPQV